MMAELSNGVTEFNHNLNEVINNILPIKSKFPHYSGQFFNIDFIRIV
jgi:hypothetical protein